MNRDQEIQKCLKKLDYYNKKYVEWQTRLDNLNPMGFLFNRLTSKMHDNTGNDIVQNEGATKGATNGTTKGGANNTIK